MNDIGIVVVTHNSEAVIGACLDAAGRAAPGVPLVVVDNASQDGTRREVQRRNGVRLIANPWNRGFAGAVNQAVDVLDGELVLLLNPDTEFLGGLDGLIAGLDKTAAVAGGKLVDATGRAQAGFTVRRFPTPAALAFEVLGLNRLWPANAVNRRYRAFDLDLDSPADVEQPAGAFLLLRRSVWRQLGGFDESFHPLWFEDVDFCRRVMGAGYRIRYVPEAVAKHSGGHSARQLARPARDLYWYGNLLLYAAKHCGRTVLGGLCLAVMLGSFLRSIVGLFRWGGLNWGRNYGRVIRLALRYLWIGQREGPRLTSAFAEQ